MKYTILKDHAQANASVTFSEDLEIFTHHFPGNPLLPGALSALLLAESCGGQRWHLKKIEGLRFRKPLTPNLPISISSDVKRETQDEKVCSGKILSGNDVIADGDFVYTNMKIPQIKGSQKEVEKIFRNGQQIREYLPHGEPIVLIDQLVSVDYPQEIQDLLNGNSTDLVEQSKLTGSKIHTKSNLSSGNFWLDEKTLPAPILSELAAQAGALTLTPFFTGTKPQVSLLGCDTEYFATAEEGSVIDTFVELKRVKRLGASSNMILFNCECFVGETKIAQVNLNAMATF